MRKTKIICTLGPSTDKDGVLRELIANGMNVARFNFSHGSHEEHKGRLDLLKSLREELGKPVAALLDTKGPEIRLKDFKNGTEMLEAGQTFTLTTRDVEGTKEICSITYKDLPQDVAPGGTIMLDDGLRKLQVRAHKGSSDEIKALLDAEDDIVLIALAHIRHGQMHTGHVDALLESREGVNNIDSILAAADAVMVARGDLGVEIDFTELPGIQKNIHRAFLLLRQAHRHRYPDAGQHDGEPPPHPRRDLGRGKRHLRRHLCHHAVR